LRRRTFHGFIEDVRRFRPAFIVVLAIVMLLPSLFQMVTRGLSVLEVLVRFVEAVVVVGVLVWLVSAVVIRFALIQARQDPDTEPEDLIAS
jgi:hypothetical protein